MTISFRSFLIFSLPFFFFVPMAHAAGSFQYSQSLTVTSTTSIASGTLTSFPMLVSSTVSAWASSAHGGDIQNLVTAPNGSTEPADLVFATSTTNCTSGSYLNFETESYNSSTGALADWVNVPTMQAGTVIYVCYDASSVTTDQSHPSSTWNSAYTAVWHGGNGSTVSYSDSTANADSLTPGGSPSAVSGEINGGIGFPTGSQYSGESAQSGFLGSGIGPRSTSVWVNFNNFAATDNSPHNDFYMMDFNNGNPVDLILQYNDATDKVEAQFSDGTSGYNSYTPTTVALATGTWYDFVMTWNGISSNQLSLFLNGALVGTTSTDIGSIVNSSEDNIFINNLPGVSRYSSFSLDEIRTTNNPLTPSWILTEYNSESSPGTFYTLGGQTSLSSAGNVSGYAWGNKMGWIALNTNFGGLAVYTSSVQGYAWSQNFGWINFGPLPSSTGVVNDGHGNLSGYAWSQGTGYINFQGVTINASGVWHGIASGSDAGSIVFDSSTGCTDCYASTTWTPSAVVPLSVSSVFVDGNDPTAITLTPATTTNVNVEATITDNTCSEITGGTTTILFYRSGVTSSSCLSGSGNGVSTNLNCYQAAAFTASSTCSGGVVNTTTTIPIQYFAQATDASSSHPSQNWIATVIFKDSTSATSSVDSTHTTSTDVISTLTALNVTTSSINYGRLNASSTTGSANQTTTILNAGNSSTTLQLSGAALANGSITIATSSQHYATSTFTFGGGEQSLSGSATAVSGFLLTSPTSTSNVQSTIYWGVSAPNNTASGTYSGTNTFTAVFSN